MKQRGQCIAVVSGKGGTGKTSFVSGVGASLALDGKKVLCLDCDIRLRNLDLALGLSDRALMDFSDVAQGRCGLSAAAVEHPKIPGLFLLTAPVRSSPITESQMKALLNLVRDHFDYCLLDAPAGLGSGFQLATCGADRCVVVTTSDASSLRDAQHTVMELDRFSPGTLHLVVNRVRRKMLRSMHATIDDAIDKAGLPLLGVVPEDDALPVCLNRGIPSPWPRAVRPRPPTATSPDVSRGIVSPCFVSNKATILRKEIAPMNIALMSHDNKKGLMVQFCTAYAGILSKHNIFATNTTGHMVADATGLKVHCYLTYAHGGSQQIGARITYNEFDMVLFFNDPSNESMAGEISYISRLCDQNNIPFASNIATAEMLVLGLARGDLDWRTIVNPAPRPIA